MEISNITNPNFLKKYNIAELNQLCQDIREFIIDNISITGGHLASNLGVVELTVALHYVFNSPYDKFIFDVGHQSYTHKILTGRANDFKTLRQFNGLSGFQKRCESEHDPFEAGHTSTSIAGALGFAFARDLNHDNYDCIAIIGDGALTGGLAFETLNNVQNLHSKIIIVLNDNGMSISPNVGGLSTFLKDIRISSSYDFAKKSYKDLLTITKLGTKIYNTSSKAKEELKKHLNNNIFTDLDIDYLGPIDGHNMEELIAAFTKARSSKKSILVHVKTKKGKGYTPAEENSSAWHGVSTFDKVSGTLKKSNQTSISQIVSNTIHEFMTTDENLITITPAMIGGK